ncbi:MAG: DUF4326 domain-containing protein [Pseudonocardia sp.]|nr:DUF4326 domain-containing protein [Pseudonocardia sp.]
MVSVSPVRIQLRRVKGWRKPAGVIVVARPTRWGNPYRWTDYLSTWVDEDGVEHTRPAAERRRLAVVDFEAAVRYGIGGRPDGYPAVDEIRRDLAGRDLACWCPPEQRCHGDVLLAIANQQAEGPPREG